MAETFHIVTQAITAEHIRRYGELTNDFNPIHTDPAFAAATTLGTVIAHGTLSLNLIWQSLALTLGNQSFDSTTLDIRFLVPVRVDDVITTGGRQGPDGNWEVWAVNQQGGTVISGVFRQQKAHA